MFDRIEFTLDSKYYSGKKFSIIAHNNSQENIYIQKAKLNGKAYDLCHIDFAEVAAGATLELFMGKKPNKNWGKN
jgi:putative alpha-1,2-mannosidase